MIHIENLLSVKMEQDTHEVIELGGRYFMAPKEFLKTENFLKTEILKNVSIPTWSKIFKYRTLSNTEEAVFSH